MQKRIKIFAQHPDTLIPKEDELRDNFMARCMNNEQMQQDYDQGQRQNQCQLIWSEHMEENTNEITLFGGVGEEITAARLKMELDEGSGDVDINLFSGGGDLFEAAAIFSILKQYKKENRVRIFVHGLAASAGAFIAVAGDQLIMEENAMLMIHNAWTIAAGDKEELRDVADRIEKQQQSMVNALMQKSGKDREEIEAMLDAETWMTAAEAIDEGFADAVFEVPEDDRVAASVDREQAKDFKHIPDSVKVTGKQQSKQQKSDTMDKAVLKACNLQAGADASDVLAFISNIKAEKKALEGKVDELKADKTDLEETNQALQQSNADLKETNEALKESTQEQQVDAIVDEVLEDAGGVKLGDEAKAGLRRRAERYVKEDDEDRKADIKEDMTIFASAKGVKTGSGGFDHMTSIKGNQTSPNDTEASEGGGLSYEKKLMNKIDMIQNSNPDMSFEDAKIKAQRMLDQEKLNGSDPVPHSAQG